MDAHLRQDIFEVVLVFSMTILPIILFTIGFIILLKIKGY